jgi:hypothetical protein
VLALLAVLAIAVSAAGCVSIPSGGPVRSYTVTQGPGAQSQQYLQMYPLPPGNGWSPEDIVRGFLNASASFANRQQIAREYLTPDASRAWNPNWSATVFSNGPTVSGLNYPAKGSRTKAVVTVTGKVQATLSGYGSYAVPSAKEQGAPATFDLTKASGQWRIYSAPPELLLTSDLFKYDYQLRNLYFFDPTGHSLVPDPVYVPLQATPVNLMNRLVHDLIKPPRDWLSDGAAMTAFPPRTNLISDVTLAGGTATVNLGGAIAKASASVLRQVLPQVSAQLLWTLTGSGQGGSAVQSVELSVNGIPQSPPNSGQNPVQNRDQSQYSPPTGASSVFYYLDDAGNLRRRDGTQGKPVTVAHVGAGYSQIAVSPGSGHYLAALHDGSLFLGPVRGKLARQDGTGYTSMSWDRAGNLWATMSDQIVMLRGAASPQQSPGQPVPVTVVDSGGYLAVVPFTALRVAPDGVRVAIIVGDTDLSFGAIVPQPGVHGGQATIKKIVLSPFSVTGTGTTTFSAVTWYGPDNVITLGGPGQVLTEYPVDGGSSTSIPSPPSIQSITASSSGSALVAGVAKGGMMVDASLTGPWMSIRGTGISPAYPG